MTFRLHRIEIRNFKCIAHLDVRLDLPAGLYLVSGNNKVVPSLGSNGVGKSTLFDALFWSLWGKTIRDNKPGSAIAPWNGSKSVNVQTIFSRDDGVEQAITRRRSPNGLVYWREGENAREIAQADIPTLVGFSEEICRRTLILGQFGALFLDLRPELQAQMFSEALGLEIWLEAAERARQGAKSAQNEVAALEASQRACEAAIQELTTQLEEASKASKGFERECENVIRKKLTNKKAITAQLANVKALREPKAPDNSSEVDDVINAIGALPEASSKTEARIRRRFAGKSCGKCGQPLPNQKLVSELDKLATTSEEMRTGLNVRLRALRREQYEAQEEFDIAYKAYVENKTRRDHLDRAIRLLDSEIDEERDRENPHQKTIQTLGARLKAKKQENGANSTKLKRERETATIAEFWQKGFREIRLSIIDEALTELEIASCRHLELLGLPDWRIRFETERETKQGNVSYTFTVWITPADGKEPVKWESYSGGESQRLQLAIAFGLSEVLLSRAGVDPNIEILDEPTKGLSPEGVEDLMAHLRDRALELDRAIFVVEHHSLPSGMFDKTMLVTRTKKGSTYQWQ